MTIILALARTGLFHGALSGAIVAVTCCGHALPGAGLRRLYAALGVKHSNAIVSRAESANKDCSSHVDPTSHKPPCELFLGAVEVPLLRGDLMPVLEGLGH